MTIGEATADGLGNMYVSGETNGSPEGPNAVESDAFVAKYVVVREPASITLLGIFLLGLLVCARRAPRSRS